jgi:hypothetical protein
MNSCPECGCLLEKWAHQSEAALQVTDTHKLLRENFRKPHSGERNAALPGMEMNVFGTRHRSIDAALALFERSMPPARVLVLPLGINREFTVADLGEFAGAGETAVVRCRELAPVDWFIVSRKNG